MPNHFHFLIRVNDNAITDGFDRKLSKLTPLEKAFRDFFISYAKAINKRYDRVGSLFQYKFKRKEVEDELYLLRLTDYIHYNPIRSRLCSRYIGWEFSSYNEIINRTTGIIPIADTCNRLFKGREAFILFHEEYAKGQEGKSAESDPDPDYKSF